MLFALSTTKIADFRMQGSFGVEIFRLIKRTKTRQYVSIAEFFNALVTEKISPKPISPYVKTPESNPFKKTILTERLRLQHKQ